MIQKLKYILVIGLVLTVLIIGWYSFSQAPLTMSAENIETGQLSGSGPLDGMIFSGQLGAMGKPADVNDNFVFANGLFVSKQCEQRCNYPARPYFVRRTGDKVSFISETHCPTKDAKIVWRGTVDDETIKGEFTWTVERWYWTIEKTFWFEGSLVQASQLSSNQ